MTPRDWGPLLARHEEATHHRSRQAQIETTKRQSGSLADAATRYAKAGWAVLPVHSVGAGGECSCGRNDCKAVGKHPRTFHGFKDATTDVAIIQRWWNQWPDANIGIATGARSNVVVVDVDPKNFGDEAMFEWEVKYGDLPRELVVSTGSGGEHIYFACEAGVQVRSAPSSIPGVDLKGDGGYVVAPPSIHASGLRYTWLSQRQPPAMPTVLLETARPASRGGLPPTRELLLNGVPEGQRDDAIFRLMCRLRREGVPVAEAQLMALFTAQACTPPFPPDAALAKVQQAYKYPASPDSSPLGLCLLTAAELMSRPPPRWLVPGVLPDRGIFQLWGAPNVGKSFVAIDLALSVATGQQWMEVPVEPRDVLYVAMEGSWDLGQRIQAWAAQHGCQPDRFFAVVESEVSLQDGVLVATVVDAAAEAGASPSLVIIDTLALALGGDENSTRDMSTAVRTLKRLSNELGALVGLVHHTGWDKSRERGSSALRAAVDTAIECERGRLRCSKQRSAKYFDDIHYQLLEVGGSAVPSRTSALSYATSRMGDRRDRILAFLTTEPGANRSTISKAVGGHAASIKAEIDLLISEGVLTEKPGTGRERRYYLTELDR